MKSNVVLATVGSLGDLHPFIALGLALERLGVRVLLTAAAEYEAKVKLAGLRFQAVRPSFADMQAAVDMNRSELTRAALARSDFLLERLIMPHLIESYTDASRAIQGADMVLTSSLAFGMRLAAEHERVAWLGIVLQPSLFFSAYDPPEIPRAPALAALLRLAGPSVTRRAFGIVRHALRRQLRPVADLRVRLKLGPTRGHPLFEGQFSIAGALALYSPLIGALQADFPQPSCIAGFAGFDSEDGAASTLDAALAHFLECGPPPVVFTLGSLIVNSPGNFFWESAAAAQRVGRRAVLIVGEDTAAYSQLTSDAVHVCRYAPHSLVFPRSHLIVHQGGIGTLAQALRSGRPQLIVPFYGDQADNAARAARLGVALAMSPRRYRASPASRTLETLNGPSYRRRATEVGSQLAGEDGAVAGAAFVLRRLCALRGCR